MDNKTTNAMRHINPRKFFLAAVLAVNSAETHPRFFCNRTDIGLMKIRFGEYLQNRCFKPFLNFMLKNLVTI